MLSFRCGPLKDEQDGRSFRLSVRANGPCRDMKDVADAIAEGRYVVLAIKSSRLSLMVDAYRSIEFLRGCEMSGEVLHPTWAGEAGTTHAISNRRK